MIDMEQARLVNEQREQAERDAAILTEAWRIEHANAAAVTQQNMIDSKNRRLAAEAAADAAARAQARILRDERDALQREFNRLDSKAGYTRADLVEAQKQIDRHRQQHRDLYATPQETEKLDAELAQRVGHHRRIAARLGIEAGDAGEVKNALDAAQYALTAWERNNNLG